MFREKITARSFDKAHTHRKLYFLLLAIEIGILFFEKILLLASFNYLKNKDKSKVSPVANTLQQNILILKNFGDLDIIGS